MLHRARHAMMTAALAGAAFWSLAGPAQAANFRIADRSLAIEPPPSYCAVDRGIAEENDLVEFIEQINAGLNRVLLVFVDCDELGLWRSGRVSLLQRYGQVLTPIEEVAYRGMPRTVFLEQLEMAMDRAIPVGVEAGRARMETVLPELEAGQTESLGVLDVDDLALYAAIAQKMGLGQTEVVMAGVFAMTLVKDVPISVNLYRPYDGGATIDTLAREQRDFIEDLMKKNDSLETRRESRPKESATDG